MSRPAKSTATVTGHRTKDEIAHRKAAEDALRGGTEKLEPPDWLNDGQIEVFRFVIDEMKASGVLGNLDLYVLTQFSVAAERLVAIEMTITQYGVVEAANYKELIAARSAYMKDFWRGINELSLSPQARAKIGTLNLNRNKEDADPVRKLLAGKGTGAGG